MASSILEYLKERLSPDHFQALRDISEDFHRPLFTYDPKTRRFECAGGFDPDETDEEAIDALCIACELLSEAGIPFDLASPLIESDDEPGVVRLTYEFTKEEEAVYDRFKKLLRENATPAAGFKTDFQKYPGGFRVVVDLEFQTDYDYQQKKGIVELMLLVAKKRSKGAPILGNRLS